MPRVLIVTDDGLTRQGLSRLETVELLSLRFVIYQDLPIRTRRSS
jgi:hypothetical protein